MLTLESLKGIIPLNSRFLLICYVLPRRGCGCEQSYITVTVSGGVAGFLCAGNQAPGHLLLSALGTDGVWFWSRCVLHIWRKAAGPYSPSPRRQQTYDPCCLSGRECWISNLLVLLHGRGQRQSVRQPSDHRQQHHLSAGSPLPATRNGGGNCSGSSA